MLIQQNKFFWISNRSGVAELIQTVTNRVEVNMCLNIHGRDEFLASRHSEKRWLLWLKLYFGLRLNLHKLASLEKCAYELHRMAVKTQIPLGTSWHDMLSSPCILAQESRDVLCRACRAAWCITTSVKGASPQHGLWWTCPPHFFQKLFLRLLQIQSTKD